MITTTLNAIRAHRPCEIGWTKLLKYLGKTKADDEPLPLLTILESNGAADTIWCFRALGPEHHRWIVTVACDIAERALRFVPAGEDRPRLAIETARAWLRGAATVEQVMKAAAYAADGAAAWAADGAAAWAAAEAAWEAAEREAQAAIIRRHLT